MEVSARYFSAEGVIRAIAGQKSNPGSSLQPQGLGGVVSSTGRLLSTNKKRHFGNLLPSSDWLASRVPLSIGNSKDRTEHLIALLRNRSGYDPGNKEAITQMGGVQENTERKMTVAGTDHELENPSTSPD